MNLTFTKLTNKKYDKIYSKNHNDVFRILLDSLIIIFIKISFINTSSVSPTQRQFNPYYFGTEFVQFYSSSDNSNNAFTSSQSPYTINRTLSRTYSNISKINSVLSTFQSNVNYYFGFTIENTSLIGNPATKIQIKFSIISNSAFARLGLHSFMVGYPLTQVFYAYQFNLISENTYYYINRTIPPLFNSFPYIISFIQKSFQNSSYFQAFISVNVDSTNSRIGVSVDFRPDQTYYNHFMKYLIIFIDRTKILTMTQLSLFTYQSRSLDDGVLNVPYFGISISNFGIDLRKQCIIGIPLCIQKFNSYSPYFVYDLSSTAVINGNNNIVSNYLDSIISCYKLMKCPSSHPFHLNGSNLCYDCSDGFIKINDSLILHCKKSIERNSYNYSLEGGQNILSKCLLCIDCQNLYFAQNGSCHLCQVKYQNCINCQQIGGCYDCDRLYIAQSNGTCLLCSLNITNCLQCQQNIGCTKCKSDHYFILNKNCYFNCSLQYPTCNSCNQTFCFSCINNNYFLQNGTCYLCEIYFPNCITCDQKIKCLSCSLNISLLQNGICKLCSQYIDYCFKCTDQKTCIKCIDNYQLSNITGHCQFFGCLTALKPSQSQYYNCYLCSKKENYNLINDTCVCQSGFQFSSLTEKCQQICGDGKVIRDECDDGNNINGDGCNSTCFVQEGFNCSVKPERNICYFNILLQLQIKYIHKNQNNSALLYIKAINKKFPYPLKSNQFSSNFNAYKYIQIHILLSQNPPKSIQLRSQLIYAQDDQIRLMIYYDFDIQKLPASLKLNTSKTRYICQNDQVILNFQMKGSNGALKKLKLVEFHEIIRIASIIITTITMFLLFLGLFSNKYIALQCILTLQLIYFSQYLINPTNNWPISFQSLQYLKYVNGFNEVFQQKITFVPFSQVEKKLNYMSIKKTVIQNYNISFLILLLTNFLFFICSYYNFVKIKQYQKRNKFQNERDQNKLSQQRSFFRLDIDSYWSNLLNYNIIRII